MIKPKIRIEDGWWVCSCTGYDGLGIGATPAIAFENWNVIKRDFSF